MSEVKKPALVEADIVTREWRHGMHLPTGRRGEDLHLVKEVLTMKDGSKRPHMRVIRDFERPIWMTKLQYRTHEDKKEYEKLSKLDMHLVKQSQLRNSVAVLVGKPTSPLPLSELLHGSPFIYAADIPSVAILNRELYQKPNQEKKITPTPYKVGAFDTETDVVYGTGEIIIGSMCVWPRCHLVIRKDWLGYDGPDLDHRLMSTVDDKLIPVLDAFFEKMEKKHGSRYPERTLELTYEIVPDEITLVERSMAWFHHEMPDWMAIWNLDFDVTKILDACKRADVDPMTILCDPRVPPDYRICRYKRGQNLKKAASGKGKPVSPHDQWHTLFLTASFYVIDSMSVYRLLRLGEQEERSYSLDAILDKEFEGALHKLKHPPADKYVKEKWHQVMQRDHKFVYLAYAAMDTIAMCLLDRKTRDLSHRLPDMADITDFSQCNSQPKRLRDAFFVFAHDDHQCVTGSVGFSRDAKKVEVEKIDLGDESEERFDEDGEEGEDEEDEEYSVLPRTGWVLTLGSHYSAPGLKIIRDNPDVTTGLRGFVYDSDAVSSYPSCTQVGNVSKVTTRKEICKVGSYDDQLFRNQGLNLLFGEVNAVEYTTKMFQAPTLMQLLDIYDTRQAA